MFRDHTFVFFIQHLRLEDKGILYIISLFIPYHDFRDQACHRRRTTQVCQEWFHLGNIVIHKLGLICITVMFFFLLLIYQENVKVLMFANIQSIYQLAVLYSYTVHRKDLLNHVRLARKMNACYAKRKYEKTLKWTKRKGGLR